MRTSCVFTALQVCINKATGLTWFQRICFNSISYSLQTEAQGTFKVKWKYASLSHRQKSAAPRLLLLKSIIQILLVVAANVASLPFGSRYLDFDQQSSFMAEIPSSTSQNFILAAPKYSFCIFKLNQTPMKPFYQSCSSTTFGISCFFITEKSQPLLWQLLFRLPQKLIYFRTSLLRRLKLTLCIG